MSIDPRSTRTPAEVYAQFTSGEDGLDFSRTVLSVKLLEEAGAPLVSRSQAKRLLARLTKFKEVVLNFDGVQEIGQAFADEIFRVYPAHHPEIRLIPINTVPAVEQIIDRVSE